MKTMTKWSIVVTCLAAAVVYETPKADAQTAESPTVTAPTMPPAGPTPAPASTAPPPAPAYPPQPVPPGYYPGYAPAYGPPPGYYAAPPVYYSPPAYYPPQPEAPPAGYHKHDGFFLRLQMGFGFLRAGYSNDGYDTSYSGAGLAGSFACGGSITDHIVLFGEVVVTSALSPKYKDNIGSRSMSDDVNLYGIGPGMAYYLDSNFYFSGTFTIAQVTQDRSNSSSSDSSSIDLSNKGFGVSLMAGKEWWVSPNWGMGAALRLQLASMTASSVDARMSAAAISLLYSATYN
jgi:hypothetical protein